MPATDRFSLVVESVTRGDAEVRKFTEAINKLATVTEGAAQRTKVASDKSAAAARQFANREFADSVRNFVQSPLQAASVAAENFALSMGKTGLIAAGAVVGIAAVTAASFKLVSSVGAAAEQMVNLADRTGLTVAQVDKLQAMGKIAGVSIQSLESSARVLSQAIEGTGETGDKAREALDRLGVATIDGTGKQREMGTVLNDVIKSLAAVTDTSKRTFLATQILGRGATEILPLVKAYQELDRATSGFGTTAREKLVRDLAAAGDTVDLLGLKWERLKQQLAVPASAVVGVTVKVVEAFEALSGGASTGSAGRAGGPEAVFGGPRQGPRGPGSPVVSGFAAGFAADVNSRITRARGFRERTLTGQSGLEARLKEVVQERSALERMLSSSSLSLTAGRQLEGDLKRLVTEQERIEAQLKRLRAPNAGAFVLREGDLFGEAPRPRSPSLFGRFGTFESPESERIAAAPGSTAEFGAGLLEARRASDQRRISAARQLADFESERIRLLAGPGGELDAVNQITAVRLAALEQQRVLGADLFAVEQERQRILNDAILQRLAVERKRLDDFRNSAGQIFDALVAGGRTSLSDFLRGQVLTIGRTVFQNVAGEVFKGASGRLTIPGQRTGGSLNLFGRVLAGTPFGDIGGGGLVSATTTNTQATIENTAALYSTRGGIAGVAGTASLPGLPGGVFRGAGPGGMIFSAQSGAARGTVGQFFSGIGALGGNPLGAIFTPSGQSVQIGSGVATTYTTAERVGAAAGAAAVVAAGVVGVKGGIQQGGFKGTTQALASGLGTAAALDPEPISKAILATAASIAGIANLIAPDPKQVRDRQLNELIASGRFTDPLSTEFGFTSTGGGFDRNRLGFREAPAPIIVQVQTLDSRSFLDNSEEIADAVRYAMQRGHQINRTAQEVVLNQ
jgi:hypothetical protein